MPACPICQRPAAPRAENKAFPFCSARCKQIDLAKWLTGDYRIETNEQSDALRDTRQRDSSDSDGSGNRLPAETSNRHPYPAAGNRKEFPS